MIIKKNDTVVVLSGKDRGKRGKVLHVDRERDSISIEGINLYRKHSRPKQQGEKSELITLNRPLASAKVALLCPACDRGVRVGIRTARGEAKERYCKRCKGTL